MESPTKSSLKTLSKDALISQNEALMAQLSAQEKTIQRQSASLDSYQQQTRDQSEALAHKDAFIEQLKEALILSRNRQFAKLSESTRYLQMELFNEAEEASLSESVDDSLPDQSAANEKITVAAHTRSNQGKGRKPLPSDLPRHDVIHDLSDDEKICAHDGHALVEIADKVSEQLDIIPMQLRVIRHIRKQYVCRRCQEAGRTGCVHTATKPTQAIAKSIASSGLLSYIAVSKYADGLPLYRQSSILKRFNIELDRTTMANWMIQCGRLAQPVINRLEEQLLSNRYIHMDETPVQVLNEKGKAAQSTSYMWVRCVGPPGQRIILFDYDASRSGEVPKRLLSGYEGALMVDGYAGYDAVCADPQIQRLGCVAHARRKFVEVVKSQKKGKRSPADKGLRLIAKLYQIEKQLNEANSDTAERHAQRIERAKPIWDELYRWSVDIKTKVAPKTTLGKAVSYLHSQWDRLTAYLEDGDYPIDNNPVENAIRPFAIGRKNWLFSTSVQGAKASANLYSLIETAKAHGIEPYGYLKYLFDELPNIKDYDDVDKLLPNNFQPRT